MSQRPGPLGTLAFATAGGGTNWSGGSLDPETGIAYVPSQKSLSNLGLVPSDPKTNDFRFVQGNAIAGARTTAGAGADGGAEPAGAEAGAAPAVRLTVQELPLFKPPYGQISAIDMNKGEILWQVARGETPDAGSQSSGAQGPHHSAHRPRRNRRPDRDQDAGDRRRARHHHHARRQEGRVSARVRQEDREGRGRGADACRTDRFADDVHAERQAVHRRGGRRRRFPGRISARTGCRTDFVPSHHCRRRPQRPGDGRVSCARRGAGSGARSRANWWAAALSPKRSGPATAFRRRPTSRA